MLHWTDKKHISCWLQSCKGLATSHLNWILLAPQYNQSVLIHIKAHLVHDISKLIRVYHPYIYAMASLYLVNCREKSCSNCLQVKIIYSVESWYSMLQSLTGCSRNPVNCTAGSKVSGYPTLPGTIPRWSVHKLHSRKRSKVASISLHYLQQWICLLSWCQSTLSIILTSYLSTERTVGTTVTARFK